MREIFEIFKSDLKMIFKKASTLVVIVGLIILPSMYAWPNILASWDPYSHTNGLKVAVFSEDEEVSVLDKKINIGHEVIEGLHNNNNLSWVFVNTKDEALEGVRRGDYYASIVIPKHFSENLTSIVKGDPKKAEIEYSVNEKINAISPKITSKGASGIAESITKNFIETSNKIIFKKLHELGVTAEDNLPKIKKIKNTLEEANGNFYTYENKLIDIIEKIQEANRVIGVLENNLPRVSEGLDKSLLVIDKSKNTLENVESFNKKLLLILNSHIEIASSTLNLTKETIKNSKENITNTTHIKNNAEKLNDKLEVSSNVLSKLTNILEKLNVDNNSDVLNSLIADSKNVKEKIDNIKDLNADIKNKIERGEAVTTELLDKVLEVEDSSSKKLASFKENLNNNVAKEVENTLKKVDSKLTYAKEMTTVLKNKLPIIQDELYLKDKELQSGYSKLLNVKEKIPIVKSDLELAVNKINEAQSKIDFDKLLTLLKTDYKKQAEFFATPVGISEKDLYHIENYGSAMTSFYTVLALWVGAVLITSLLTTRVKPEDKYKPYQKYFGRGLTFTLIAILQASIVSLGDMFILGTQASDKIYFFLFSIFIALIFTSIIYTIVSIFGNVGKAMCIVLLVLQIGSSGGTFPIQMTSEFFQALYPRVPFSYAVSLMREAVGGVYMPVVIKDISHLLNYLVGAIVLGIILKTLIAKSKTLSKEKEKPNLFL